MKKYTHGNKTYSDLFPNGPHAYHFSKRFPTPWIRVVVSLPVWLSYYFLYATLTGRHIRRHWLKIDNKGGWNEWERADRGFYTLKQWADDATDFCIDGSYHITLMLLALVTAVVIFVLR